MNDDTDRDPHQDDGNATVTSGEAVFPPDETPAGAEEVPGDPEKPDFGEDFDPAGTDATEEHADFEADEDDTPGVQPA